MGMKITISKHDILTLRREMASRLEYLLNTPAAKSQDPQFVAVVADQIGVLRKFIRKLNHACVQEFGHNCNAEIACSGLDIQMRSSVRRKDAIQEQVIRDSISCHNCGELIVDGDEPNVRVDCSECGKSGCTLCVEMTETETCCCVPE